MKTKRLNLDNKDVFFNESKLGWFLREVSKTEREAHLLYKLLLFIKNNMPYGIRIYGNQQKVCRHLQVSYPYYKKLLERLTKLGLVKIEKRSNPIRVDKILKKEDTTLDNDCAQVIERPHKSKFVTLSHSTMFVGRLYLVSKEWIEFRRVPIAVELTEEDEPLEEVKK